jgi:transmembrane sensor
MPQPADINVAHAEAAIWLARLRADDRSEADARAFQTWLHDNPLHAEAFEGASAVWELTGGLDSADFVASTLRKTVVSRRAALTGVGALAIGATGFGLWRMSQAGVYETNIGAQEHVTLDDGTVAFLDTDTRIQARFADDVRMVRLDRGRVNFRVAPDPHRPFVVEAADERVVASQTTFDIRRDGDTLSVVLLRGTASITPSPQQQPHVLSEGDRFVSVDRVVRVDKPNLRPLLAWQFGQAIFENQSLADAATEMNRYSNIKLVPDETAAKLRFSGVYRLGDNSAFARSIALFLPVQVEIVDDEVRLVADPTRLNQS